MREQNVLETIASRIRSLRGEMTQREFADLFGVSPQAVSEWENANKMPRIGIIEKISEKFNVPRAYILGENISDPQQKKINPRAIPIIDSIERNSKEFESLTPEQIVEIADEIEKMIEYAKKKRS